MYNKHAYVVVKLVRLTKLRLQLNLHMFNNHVCVRLYFQHVEDMIAYISPTSWTYVSPTCWTYVSPTCWIYVSPTSWVYVSQTSCKSNKLDLRKSNGLTYEPSCKSKGWACKPCCKSNDWT